MCLISAVVPARNRWIEVGACLNALAQQKDCPQWEIIIIDDGSEEPVPSWLQEVVSSYIAPVRLKRQAPLGIAAARNQGASLALGELILFLDSDSLPTESCLSSLADCAANHPEDVAFQCRISAKLETWVGRMDSLFLTSVQDATLKKDGHILYADTCGFAVRRGYFKQPRNLFEVGVVRGADTLLMTDLSRQGKQLKFVPDAIIHHNHDMPLLLYLRKHFTIGYRAGRADKVAKDLQDKEWITSTRRQSILRGLLANAPRQPGGYRALALVLIAYIFKMIGRVAYSLFGLKPGRRQVLNSPVDAVTPSEVVARLVQAGEGRTGLAATYVNSWSLIKAERNSIFRESLTEFELCIADGIGVVYTLFLTKLTRIAKVTANDFYVPLFQEAANRGLKVALIGAKEGVAQAVARQMCRDFPTLQVVFCSSGYLSRTEEEDVMNELKQFDAHVVLVGRGQPTQELWVQKCRNRLPNTVFLCVGGLFDYISGDVHPTPIWIRRAGFEWLHHVIHHPRRYWYRYAYGIPALLWYLAKYHLTRISR
jgi:N-acetylglucosaminyldiphosphoundecaprenol N-acetyl-beta-D-mannosaminyltransferase